MPGGVVLRDGHDSLLWVNQNETRCLFVMLDNITEVILSLLPAALEACPLTVIGPQLRWLNSPCCSQSTTRTGPPLEPLACSQVPSLPVPGPVISEFTSIKMTE